MTEIALTLDGAVSPDAVRGIEGAFGMLESFGTGTPSFDDYNSRWLTVSSTVGCDRVVPYAFYSRPETCTAALSLHVASRAAAHARPRPPLS